MRVKENVMFSIVLEFVNLLLAALVTGAMFGVWLILNPVGQAAGAYVELHQRGVRTVNTILPRLGAATILVTIVAAIAARGDRLRVGLLVATAVCFVTIGLVTRFLNQPINAVVMTWNSDALPAGWERLRDAWWRWHFLRLAAGLAGVCLLIGATVVCT
jgi:hypothetical protein